MTDTTNDQVSPLREIVSRAVEVLNRHIVPDGISDNDALIELYGIFDGPEYRAAIQHSEQRETVPASLNCGAIAGNDEPERIILNGMPVEHINLDWVCSLLSEETIFNGGDLLQAYNKLVAFYVARRNTPAAPVAAPVPESKYEEAFGKPTAVAYARKIVDAQPCNATVPEAKAEQVGIKGMAARLAKFYAAPAVKHEASELPKPIYKHSADGTIVTFVNHAECMQAALSCTAPPIAVQGSIGDDAEYQRLDAALARADRAFCKVQSESNGKIVDAARAALVAYIDSRSPVAAAPGLTLDSPIIKFLTGEEAYDGVWFGERHPDRQGAFWWRAELRAALSAAAPSADAKDSSHD